MIKKTLQTPLSIRLPYQQERSLPPFSGGEDRYPESVVRYFLKQFTKKNDRVFDPFMGLGTTAFIAEDMGRIPYGIEHDRQRFEWVSGQLTHWQNIIQDDAFRMDCHALPKMDFCITSPPYMPRHHKWNPLFSGNPKHAGYQKYLARMGAIFKKMTHTLKKGGHMIVQLDNLKHGRIYTPLVHDISTVIEKSMTLESETIVIWENPKPDYLHTHCLLFKNITK